MRLVSLVTLVLRRLQGQVNSYGSNFQVQEFTKSFSLQIASQLSRRRYSCSLVLLFAYCSLKCHLERMYQARASEHVPQLQYQVSDFYLVTICQPLERMEQSLSEVALYSLSLNCTSQILFDHKRCNNLGPILFYECHGEVQNTQGSDQQLNRKIDDDL